MGDQTNQKQKRLSETQSFDNTKQFSKIDSRTEMRETLTSVYKALTVKGYNPINQLVGYILSEDPTYITNYNSARSMIARLDRDELLQELLYDYLGPDVTGREN